MALEKEILRRIRIGKSHFFQQRNIEIRNLQYPFFARLLLLKWAGGGVAWTVHSQLLLSDFSLLVPRNFASDFYILATISHLVEIRKTTCKLISELNTDIKHYHTENGKCVQIELCFNAFNKKG